MGRVKKAIWLSYDLGIGGDYPGLYKWLDNHRAIECGDSVAFFFYTVDNNKLDQLLDILFKDIDQSVELRSGDRLYVIRRVSTDTKSSIKGKFIYGKRKSNPWEGYGDTEPTGSDDGE